MDRGSINLDAIPIIDANNWQRPARPYVPMLVQAFQQEGISSPIIYAYACASISRESSWNPRAENTTDAASRTGYPGRGLAQVTWEINYRAVSNATGIDFLNNPDLMFDPYNALRAKAAFFKLNRMLPLIESGDYESAAGLYNAGRASFRSSYTRNVANDTPLWVPVFAGLVPSGPTGGTSSSGEGRSPSRLYVIQPGDTLSAITARFGVSIESILAINPQITNPNLLMVGDSLTLPVRE